MIKRKEIICLSVTPTFLYCSDNKLMYDEWFSNSHLLLYLRNSNNAIL